MVAAMKGHNDICRILLENSADSDLQDQQGKNAEQIALEYGHPLTVKLLKKFRITREIQKLGQEQQHNIGTSNMPLKMFIAGPPEAGKTTLLNSLMHYVSTDQDSKEKQKENSKGSLRNTGQSLLRNRNEHICDDHQERTIGLNVHFEKLFENNPFLVYDLGGQESYYALQAIFLDVDNAFFLVVINMLDNTDELTKHIDKQLSIISSKLPRDAKSAVVLIGTHCENELMDDEEREDKESTIMVTGNSFMDKCENLMLQEEYLFMDARKKKSEEIKVLTGICTDIAVDARKVMHEDMKKIPTFILAVREALHNEALKQEKKILDWKLVLDIVKETCKQEISVEVNDKQVYLICTYLSIYGLVFMTSPSNGFLSKDYHRDNFKCLLTTDLNWLLSELLGTILSPNKFLNNKKICSDGYVSQQSLKCAFKGFKEFKDFEDLVQILDHYKFIIEIKEDDRGKKHFLIPSALRNEKNPHWMTWTDKECPFYYLIGRACISDMDLNPATVSKIQHSIGKLFPLSKPVFFRNGVYIVEDQFQILVQPVLSYLGFQVIIGIDKERLRSPSNAELRETLKKLGQYLDKIFTETICGEMEEANPSLTLTRMALSLEMLKKNGDSNELVYYDLEIVQERFRCGHKFIDSEEFHKGDALVLLLTDSEIKESRRETKDVEAEINECLEVMIKGEGNSTIKPDLSSNVQIISGNIGKIQIGPTNISVAEARNVTIGDEIKISTDRT